MDIVRRGGLLKKNVFFDGRTTVSTNGLDVGYKKKKVVKDHKLVSLGRWLNGVPKYWVAENHGWNRFR